MEGSPLFQRALLLQEQGRHELAERELRQHLAEQPDDGIARAALAGSLLELKRLDEAEQTARSAIAAEPDSAFVHFTLARVLLDRNRLEEAVAAILEAIRIEPADADYHGCLAVIQFNRERWAETLEAAETGLRFDPEHVACNNFRAMALVKLGRKAEAGATIGATLSRNPENAFSHANQGWTLLEQGKRREAMDHFRESLRLDPGNDWARSGLLEAIKAGNPIYAWLLAYFLWMQKLPEGARWGIIVGGYFGNRLLGSLASSNPDLAPWLLPLRALYLAFALLTWLASPLSNLVLFLHRDGRHALDSEQRWQARLVGGCIGLSVLSLGLWWWQGPEWIVPALVFGLLALPVSAIHGCAQGWPRNTMVAISVVLALSGLTAATAAVVDIRGLDGALAVFLVGSFASQWIAGFLASRRPER